ncbi:putative immunity protein [Streptomyces galbus]|uniref:putative immunity protein n=1 Tax=Streptomyces galbus TaxID=33898 RepID=UPI0037A324CC
MRSVGRGTPVRVVAFGEDGFVTEDASEIVPSLRDLREVAAFAAACAETVLDMFEANRPDDPRPREAVGAAWEFVSGGERGRKDAPPPSEVADAPWAKARRLSLLAGARRRASLRRGHTPHLPKHRCHATAGTGELFNDAATRGV